MVTYYKVFFNLKLKKKQANQKQTSKKEKTICRSTDNRFKKIVIYLKKWFDKIPKR